VDTNLSCPKIGLHQTLKNMDKTIIHKSGKLHSISERKQIVTEYLSGSCTKRQVWEKYTGQKVERGQLLRWIRSLGYKDKTERLQSTFTPINFAVKNINTPTEDTLNSSDTDFEKLKLEKRIQELEKQLKEAEMKAIAFSTMVSIAEKEFKIPIRKKYNTKP